MSVANQVAVVTGASRGIGASIAKRLASEGYAIIVNYAGNAEAAQAVVAAIQGQGGRAHAVQADVADPDQVRSLFQQAEDVFGGVDVLVNNAGIMQPGNVMLADTDDALFDRIVAVNLKGTFNTLRAAAQRLRDNGRIVNFSTSVVGLKLPGYSVYAATKAGVESMTAIFAKELRGRNITVNALAPGPTATELFLKGKDQALVEQMSKMPPLERLGTPEDIANAVAFMVGRDGGWVDGQTLRVNGGIV